MRNGGRNCTATAHHSSAAFPARKPLPFSTAVFIKPVAKRSEAASWLRDHTPTALLRAWRRTRDGRQTRSVRAENRESATRVEREAHSQNKECSVLTKMMKVVSIAALLLTAMLWSHAPSFGLPLRFVVGLSAMLVATQAVCAKKYSWAVGFYTVAILFNPFAAVITLAGKLSLLVVLAAAVPFAASLIMLKTQPLLSIPSITDRTLRSESL